MGYTYIPASTFLEVNTYPNAALEMSTSLTDTELVPFPAIPYTGTLTAAYMDLILPNIRNTNGASNHSNGFTLQIKDGASWRSCVVVPDPSLWVKGSDVSYGDISLCGTTDIKAYVPANTVLYPRIYQHSTNSDVFYCYDMRCRLRLYFGSY